MGGKFCCLTPVTPIQAIPEPPPVQRHKRAAETGRLPGEGPRLGVDSQPISGLQGGLGETQAQIIP